MYVQRRLRSKNALSVLLHRHLIQGESDACMLSGTGQAFFSCAAAWCKTQLDHAIADLWGILMRRVVFGLGLALNCAASPGTALLVVDPALGP